MTRLDFANVPTAQERAVGTCIRKKCYTLRACAEYAADSVALAEWRRGVDKCLQAYECEVCKHYHVGTVMFRPVHPHLAALHNYKVLASPRKENLKNVCRTH